MSERWARGGLAACNALVAGSVLVACASSRVPAMQEGPPASADDAGGSSSDTDTGSDSDDPARDAGGAAVPNDGDADDAAAQLSGLPDAATALPEWDEATLTRLRSLRYDASPAPLDPSNRVAGDPLAQRFGQTLFFDPLLSGRLLEGDNDGSGGTLGLAGEAGRVSCASCHLPASNFVDTRSPHRQISLAAQWTRRRTPTLLEIGFAPLFNWDGRRDSIWGQAAGVMENNQEFNSSRLLVAQQIARHYREPYTQLFGELPPVDDPEQFEQLAPEDGGCSQRITGSGLEYDCRGMPGDPNFDALPASAQAAVTEVMVNTAKAIAAYVAQLRCGSSRFDAWLDGDSAALTASEQRGAALFAGRANCIDCHSGPNLTDGEFHNVGLRPAVVAVAFTDTNDRGAAEGVAQLLEDPLSTRGAFSDGERDAVPDRVDPAWEGAFRTPTLRCIAEQPSFMHTGQLTSLQSVLKFFARGGDPAGGYPGVNELQALELSEEDQADLVAFVQALSGPGPDAELLGPPSVALAP